MNGRAQEQKLGGQHGDSYQKWHGMMGPDNSSEVGKNWKNLRSILEVGPKDLGDGFEERYVSEFHFGQLNFEIT